MRPSPLALALAALLSCPVGLAAPPALTFDRARPDGAVILGATFAGTFAREPEADGSRWVELAYAVSMAESDVTLSKEDFERCIENFGKYPCCPVVIEHADTDWFGDRHWKTPHGHVEELRLGERTITEMDGSTRVAATLEGRVSFDAETAPLVGAKKTWRFGSITIIKGATDEATGAGLGALLWSWSLTAHPRLTGLAPIAASLRPEQLPPELLAALRTSLGPAAPPTAPPTPPAALPPGTTALSTETPMMKFLPLLSSLGFAASFMPPTEEAAAERAGSLATLGADALKSVDLPVTATPAEFAARVQALKADAAKVPAMETELTAFRKARAETETALRAAWVDDLVEAKPELSVVKASLLRDAQSDWARFQAEFPRPSREDLLTAAAEKGQRAQDARRTEAVTVSASARTKDAPAAPAKPENVRAGLRDVLADFGLPHDAEHVTEAFSMGHTPATLRAALEAEAR